MASVPLCDVLVRVYGQEGNAVVGATVTASLDRYDLSDGIVKPLDVVGTTDQYGECTLSLWPNALGSQASTYKFKIEPADGSKRFTAYGTVPDALTAQLDLIATVPDIPGKADFQEFFDQASGLAQDLVDSANGAKVAAQAAQSAAETSASDSAGSASASASSAAAALASAASAQQSANDASASLQTATAQATAAASSASAASTSAGQANASATAAATSQAGANASATSAAGSATAASGAAATAATQAGTATTKAGEASASATAAAGSASAAAASATNAGSSATTSGTSATNAANSATAASGSATAAATSATNAAASATAAANSAASIAPTIYKPGDSGVTTGHVVSTVVIYDAPITATRTVTLNATNPQAGDVVRVTRTAGATGAFNVALGALKSLSPGQYARAFYDGATWVLDEYGSL